MEKMFDGKNNEKCSEIFINVIKYVCFLMIPRKKTIKVEAKSQERGKKVEQT